MESERERVVERLSAHFAEDHLSTQELEDRFERAYRARSAAELNEAVAGLPALAQPVHIPVPVPRRPTSPVVPASTSGERRYLAVMSTFRKTGNWTPSRVTAMRAIMANVRLDLRDATFVDSEIDFDIMAVMSEVQILVPPGVRVECDGFAVMGEFRGGQDDAAVDPDAPTVRVRGTAVMATVVVETRMPGETRFSARRRERLARKARDD